MYTVNRAKDESGSVAGSKGKKKGTTFTIDCRKPVKDKIMDIASLEKFLQGRIKVGAKAGTVGDSVIVTGDKSKIMVTYESNLLKRYLKYLTKKKKKPLKKHNIWDWLRVIASNKDRNVYELRYFNITENEGEGDYQKSGFALFIYMHFLSPLCCMSVIIGLALLLLDFYAV